MRRWSARGRHSRRWSARRRRSSCLTRLLPALATQTSRHCVPPGDGRAVAEGARGRAGRRDAAFVSGGGRKFVHMGCDAGRPVANSLTVRDVRGRLLEHCKLSELADFEERHADAGVVLPLRVWRAVAHRGDQSAPVWVSADAFLQKLHATVDPSSSNLLGACDCCLSRFGCAEDVAAYHRGFALALVGDAHGLHQRGRLTVMTRCAATWRPCCQRAGRSRRSTPMAGMASGSGAWKAPALACGRSWTPWRASRWRRRVGAEHETHFASPDQAALFHLGRTLTAVAERR